MHQVALIAVKRLNLQKPVHWVVHHCITPHCIWSVRTFLCCFAKQGKNMQRTAFFWLCHRLLRSWNWSEGADLLKRSVHQIKATKICRFVVYIDQCFTVSWIWSLKCLLKYISWALSESSRFSMRNLSRISFITFSCISEVDWASQKATVATSWGQYLS